MFYFFKNKKFTLNSNYNIFKIISIVKLNIFISKNPLIYVLFVYQCTISIEFSKQSLT